MASLALSLVDGILSEFGSLIASQSVPYFQFACCFKREWSKLKNTLSTIRGIISDLQDKLEKTNTEEERLRRLEDILKDGRDLVDKVVEGQKPIDANINMADMVFNFFSTLWFYVVLPRKMKTIRERLNDAAKDHADFPCVDLKDQYIKSYKPPAFKTQATGRETDKEAIRKRIKEYSNSNEANVSIIPIVAMGGMGKTTLAKLIYENDEEYFDLKMFVTVSPDFDKKTLVEKVISRATGKECPKLDEEQLEDCLRQKLDGRKYMLVLDDVWETNQLRWNPFQHLLMGGARGSVILVTTRDTAVGLITSNTGKPYILKPLSKDNSWSLFEQEACKFKPKLLEEKPELLTVGEEILGKCGGNPLAIKTVGGLLSDKGTYLGWLEVKNLLWELATKDTDILPSLRVSYAHLSSNQQKCFAHCALFQKGYKIKKATLIQLWMAGELIQSSKNRILEDIGEEYFKTLLNRNFFEDEEMDECGNITSCKMHDLMHDLAQTAAGMGKYSIIRNDIDGAKISKSVIHTSISKPLCQFPTSILNAKKLRTFISTVHSKEDFAKFALTFKSLRVLGLVGFHCLGNFRNSNVLDPIGKLKQLRYLDLSYSDISTLPNSVCELQNLQTLKLHCCNRLTELPRDIKELKSLRHLENYRCYQLKGIPCGIGQLTCIQTLSLFVLGEGAGLSELETLNNLRGNLVIEIRKNATTSVESRKAYLKGKEYLQTLRLNLQESDGDVVSLEALQPNPQLKVLWIDRYGGVRFPSWMLKMGNSLPCLVQIELSDCPRCVRFPLFAGLPCLKEFSLFNLQSLEYIDSYISDSSSSFSSSLKKVVLLNLPKLKEWTRVVNDGRNAKTEAVAEQPTQQLLSLNSLKILEIRGCPELTSMPLHPNVEELKLDDVSGVLIESMTMAATVSPTAAATSFTFSKLKSLQIRNCKDLMSLGEGWLGNLTSLERPEILNCPELNISDEDNDMPGLISLHSLQLSDLPKLVALPKVLQHNTVLKTLNIRYCPGLMTLPDWFGKLTSLQRLQISGCSELKSPVEGWLENLTSLKWLNISNCPELNISDEDNDMPGLISLHSLQLSDLPKLAALPKVLLHNTVLETLNIRHCPGLMTLPDWFGKLTSLHQLSISDCSELKSPGEGWLENLTSLKDLAIINCLELNISDEDNDMPGLISLHLLKLSDLPKLVALPKVLQHSTALETLKIENCPGLMTLPDWFGKLTSLQRLQISSCSELKSPVEGWLENLTSLTWLNISNYPELNISDEDNDMPGLISLHSLKLSDLPKLVALPKVLQHSTALETLKIENCPGLMTLPDWFGKLTSLQRLQISSCSELKSPVEGWLENLTSLKWLNISNCPELNISDEDNDMPGLISLHSLQLSDLPKLVALPKVLQHSTALETLKIENCPGLMTLPDWFGKLTSLQRLQISSCSELKSPVEGWLENLTSLKWLNILNCPELNISDEDNDMPGLISLHSLQLSDLPKLAALPKVLQHNTVLETLNIRHCPSLMTLPDWFGKLTSLHQLSISDCSELKSPGEGWLENLTSLKDLAIINCPELNFSDEDNDMPVLRSLHSLELQALPKLAALPKVLQDNTVLKTLNIRHCPGLMTLPDWFGKLTSLHQIKISSCSELKSPGVGWLENLTSLKDLAIINCPELNFSDEDNDMPVLRSLHSLELQALPKLAALPKVLQHNTVVKTLNIRHCPGLMTLPDWFGKLTSLRKLKISSCSELKSPGVGWLENLTSLECLYILNCPKLNFLDEDNDMPVLRSLHSLALSGLPKLAALPEVLQHSTALKTLRIAHCPGLMTLPDWFGKLTSLRRLQISNCSELKSLPEGMRCLTALQCLIICSCPYLSETCRKEMGKDWPKIAHIQEVLIE